MVSESFDKAILCSLANWPRWFANIRDQAKYEQVWEYIDPDVTGTINLDATETVQTLPPEPFIAEDVLNIEFKIQLEKYRRWEKKIKAIKSFDNHVI